MIIEYRIEKFDEWDATVKKFSNYDVYYLSGYVKGFQLHGDGEPILLYFESDGVRGINVVMKRDISDDIRFRGFLKENEYFDITTPYGYGGWHFEGELLNIKLFENEYVRWCKENNIVSEFVRFHPMIKNEKSCHDFYEVTQLGEVVHMDLNTHEDIWNHITSKNRNMIRKAVKNDVKIYNGRFPQIYEEFRTIYNKTMDKDHADKYYYFDEKFYNSVLEDLPENAQVFWAEKDGKVIAASIILFANGYMNYHLSGSVREYGSLAPTNLLLYKAALWGCDNGYKTFYLGGGVGSGEDGLLKFKKAFYKGELNHFYIGKRIFNEEIYSELLEMRDGINNHGFFPEYRG